MNDWQLVAAYARGDEEAFASLVRKYFASVYSAALRQVNDPHLAEEVAQSVFILFSRKAARLSHDVLLTGWFLRAAHFVARDALKQIHRRLKREQQAAEWAAISQEADPSWSALAPYVDEALLALSRPEQESVMARFIEGRSFREIGEQQRISEDAAQKRVSRSLEKMRSVLQRQGLKVALPAIAGLLGADLARAAGSSLVEHSVSAVQAALHGAAASKSLLLADHVARVLAWRSAVKLALIAVTIITLVAGVGFVVWNYAAPGVPAGAPFQVSDPRIEAMANEWAGMAVLAGKLIREYPQPPPAGNPGAAAYQQGYDRSSPIHV